MNRMIEETTELATIIAPEDLHCGDAVAILNVTVEMPSFLWRCEHDASAPAQPIPLQFRSPEPGIPFSVKAICLPFVLLKDPHGKPKMVDIRNTQLVRLTANFAQKAARALRRNPDKVNPLDGLFD